MINDPRERARALIEQMNAGQLAAVVHLLETLIPPEEDRDTLSDAERKAIAESDEWSKRNDPIPHERVLTELGLTVESWEKMSREP